MPYDGNKLSRVGEKGEDFNNNNLFRNNNFICNWQIWINTALPSIYRTTWFDIWTFRTEDVGWL